jgi:hypothetical protein
MGPEVPDESDLSGSGTIYNLGSGGSRLSQSYNRVAKGDVDFESLKKITSDWVPDDPAAIRFRDNVLEALNRLLNSTPDFDTGWFYVENGGNWYNVNHELGAAPRRTLVYWSDVEEPQAGKDVIAEMPLAPNVYTDVSDNLYKYGIRIYHQVDGSKSQIITADDYVFGWSNDGKTGYLRVLVWR